MSDLDSDDDIPELALSPGNGQAGGVALDDDRRAHHNALERKRRDHIKDSFSMLREVVPTLKGEKASRALILKKAADYIHALKTNISNHQKDIVDLKRQNAMLEAQINGIESGSSELYNQQSGCTEQHIIVDPLPVATPEFGGDCFVSTNTRPTPATASAPFVRFDPPTAASVASTYHNYVNAPSAPPTTGVATPISLQQQQWQQFGPQSVPPSLTAVKVEPDEETR